MDSLLVKVSSDTIKSIDGPRHTHTGLTYILSRAVMDYFRNFVLRQVYEVLDISYMSWTYFSTILSFLLHEERGQT